MPEWANLFLDKTDGKVSKALAARDNFFQSGETNEATCKGKGLFDIF